MGLYSLTITTSPGPGIYRGCLYTVHADYVVRIFLHGYCVQCVGMPRDTQGPAFSFSNLIVIVFL